MMHPMTMQATVRPTNPKLAKILDEELRRGAVIRYVDETQVVVYRENRWGVGGVLMLIILGLLTAFIVPIVLLILGALSPGGRITTYTLTKHGNIKVTKTRARG